MRKRFSVVLVLLAVTACRPTLDAASTHALARLGAPGVVTRAGLDSAVGPGPDVTQCSDGREVRRYDRGDTAVVVTLRGKWVTAAMVETRTPHPLRE